VQGASIQSRMSVSPVHGAIRPANAIDRNLSKSLAFTGGHHARWLARESPAGVGRGIGRRRAQKLSLDALIANEKLFNCGETPNIDTTMRGIARGSAMVVEQLCSRRDYADQYLRRIASATAAKKCALVSETWCCPAE